MPAEGLADLLDGVDQAFTRALLAQAIADGVDELAPVGFAHPLVDARVPDHRQLPIRHRNVDEDAMTLGRAVNDETIEYLDGELESIYTPVHGMQHTQPSRTARLGLSNSDS